MQALSNTLVLPRDQTKHCFRHWENFSSSIPPVSISPKPPSPQESTSPGSTRLGITAVLHCQGACCAQRPEFPVWACCWRGSSDWQHWQLLNGAHQSLEEFLHRNAVTPCLGHAEGLKSLGVQSRERRAPNKAATAVLRALAGPMTCPAHIVLHRAARTRLAAKHGHSS